MVTTIFSSRAARASGARASASPITEQLGLQTMKPRPPQRRRWASTSARWSALASGTTSGTSGSIRRFRALLTTARPARAKAGSISSAAAASSAEKTSVDSTAPGSAGFTVSAAAAAGGPLETRQFTASP